jgi:prepilin-type processing-associated H-X9-DG protein
MATSVSRLWKRSANVSFADSHAEQVNVQNVIHSAGWNWFFVK